MTGTDRGYVIFVAEMFANLRALVVAVVADCTLF